MIVVTIVINIDTNISTMNTTIIPESSRTAKARSGSTGLPSVQEVTLGKASYGLGVRLLEGICKV